MPWLVRVAFERHPLLVPGAAFTLSFAYFALMLRCSAGESLAWSSPEEAWGAALLYCLLPAYLLFCAPFMWRRSATSLEQLDHLLEAPEQAAAVLLGVPQRRLVIGAVAGFLWGLGQYADSLDTLARSGNLWLDLSMVAGNCMVWTTAGILLAWRFYTSAGFRRLGRDARLDLYDQPSLRPFVQVAMFDVLVVMGAVAMMPLQSLDAEFRWSNYEAGLIVAVASAIIFFFVPLWGVHRSLREQRQLRVAELQLAINDCDRRDIVRLDALVAHRERVQAMSTWPFDLRLLSRTIFYLVIPPLAWIGAALMENVVDRFL
jgi:hypothetical protein